LKAALTTIGSILFLPFAVFIVVAVVLFLIVTFFALTPRTAWDNYKWRARFKRLGRYKNPDVHPHLLSGGTLIVHSPARGWALTQCWWTPDDIASISPVSIPNDDDRGAHARSNTDKLEMPFDAWVYQRYLNTDDGSPTLLAYRRGDRYPQRLLTLKPNFGCVESWSAPVPRCSAIGDDGG
jgi:hypothetical protein